MLFSITPLAAKAENISPQTSEPSDIVTLTGKVLDGGIQGGVKHGYPLMATLTFTSGATTKTAKSDPLTGDYSVELDNSLSYTVTVETHHQGYKTTTAQLASGFTSPQNFDLYVNEALCSAPGYEGGGGGARFFLKLSIQLTRRLAGRFSLMRLTTMSGNLMIPSCVAISLAEMAILRLPILG